MQTNIFSAQGDNVLITGASSGIGRHCALTLAKHGANVILVGRNSDRLNAVEDECRKLGAKAFSVVADVQDEAQVENMIKQSQQHFDTINTVINSAGMAMRVPILELSAKQWDDVFSVNVKGTFLVSKAAADWMIQTKTAGKIINISSSSAFHTSKSRVAYSASKIAVESITRTFALDLTKHNIRVNCIAPGFITTSMTENYLKKEIGQSEISEVPMQRAGRLEEMEGVILLLATNASSYMTGSVVNIDGGYATQKV